MKEVKILAGWNSFVSYFVADSREEAREKAREGIFCSSWTEIEFLFGFLTCDRIS